jgi:hypothetical protein
MASKVWGRVFRSDTNESFSGIEVELWDPDSESEERFYTKTDEQGNYSFVDVPPGEYLVATSVNLGSRDDWPCQEFGSVGGIQVRTYTIGDVRFMAVLLGEKLAVQTTKEGNISISPGDVVQRDIDVHCHDE